MKSHWILTAIVAAGIVLALGAPSFAEEEPAPPATPGGDEKPAAPGEEGGPEGEKPGDDGEAKPVVPPEEKPPEEAKPPKKDLEEEMRLAEEYAKHPDQEIEVTLKRGTVFTGIARRGTLAELKRLVNVDGNRDQLYREVPWQAVLEPTQRESLKLLVPRALKTPGPEVKDPDMYDLRKVGIRIWYFQNTRGFIFIPYSDVSELRVMRSLSYRDSKELFKDIEDREKRLLEGEKKAKTEEAEREAVQAEFEEANRAKELAERKGLDEAEAAKWLERVKALVEKFPPDKGWDSDRKSNIMVRMIQGINPSEEEKEFYKVFDEWEKAVQDYKFLKQGK